MATIFVNIKLGAKRLGGGRNVTVTRGNAVASDVTVAIDTTKVMSRGDLMAACQAAADHLLSDTVK